MKELTLKEIQNKSLDILQTVHDYCISNGIKYSLAYGTLIGAIRHKGFIPWDDDIDIIMPRPDYNTFCKNFCSEGLSIASEHDKRSFFNFCKVFDTRDTVCKEMAPFADGINGGICIDVFPLDSVSDSVQEYSSLVHFLYPYWRRQILYRYSKASIKDIIKTFPLKDVVILSCIKFSGLANLLIKRTNKVLRSYATRYSWGETDHWSQIVNLDDGTKTYQTLSDFSYTIEMTFEGRSFCVLNGYQSFLENLYGDYMELPPEEERKPRHDRFHYYWKTDR